MLSSIHVFLLLIWPLEITLVCIAPIVSDSSEKSTQRMKYRGLPRKFTQVVMASDLCLVNAGFESCPEHIQF
jgi:hypothetical protein